MKFIIFLLSFCAAAPVVPQHDSYCVADGFTGKSVTTCSDGNPLITALKYKLLQIYKLIHIFIIVYILFHT